MEALIYFLSMILIDSFLWGFCYEQKILKIDGLNRGIYSSSIFDKIYDIFDFPIRWLFDKEIHYRVFQKIIEIGGLVIVGITTEWNWFILAGIVVAYYLSTFEAGYYVLMNQLYLPDINNMHLRRWYNVGGLIELTGQPFSMILFYIYATFGLAIMLLTSFRVIEL